MDTVVAELRNPPRRLPSHLAAEVAAIKYQKKGFYRSEVVRPSEDRIAAMDTALVDFIIPEARWHRSPQLALVAASRAAPFPTDADLLYMACIGISRACALNSPPKQCLDLTMQGCIQDQHLGTRVDLAPNGTLGPAPPAIQAGPNGP